MQPLATSPFFTPHSSGPLEPIFFSNYRSAKTNQTYTDAILSEESNLRPSIFEKLKTEAYKEFKDQIRAISSATIQQRPLLGRAIEGFIHQYHFNVQNPKDQARLYKLCSMLLKTSIDIQDFSHFFDEKCDAISFQALSKCLFLLYKNHSLDQPLGVRLDLLKHLQNHDVILDLFTFVHSGEIAETIKRHLCHFPDLLKVIQTTQSDSSSRFFLMLVCLRIFGAEFKYFNLFQGATFMNDLMRINDHSARIAHLEKVCDGTDLVRKANINYY